jgi:hypothetical protein
MQLIGLASVANAGGEAQPFLSKRWEASPRPTATQALREGIRLAIGVPLLNAEALVIPCQGPFNQGPPGRSRSLKLTLR